MRQEKIIVTCPICGKELFRTVASDTDITCSKCRNDLYVMVNGGIMTVLLSERMRRGTESDRTNRAARFVRYAKVGTTYGVNKEETAADDSRIEN